MKRGKFIVVEGFDGSGKSTLAKALNQKINEQRVMSAMLVREPGGCAIAERIRDLAVDKEMLKATPNARMLLMFAARMQLCKETIEPALSQGLTIVCDRYFLSTFVYQVLSEKADANLFSHLVSNVTVPDHLFLLSAPFDVCYQRTLGRDAKDKNGYDEISLGRKKGLWTNYNSLLSPMMLEQMGHKEATILDGLKTTEELVSSIIERIHETS